MATAPVPAAQETPRRRRRPVNGAGAGLINGSFVPANAEERVSLIRDYNEETREAKERTAERKRKAVCEQVILQ